MRVKTPVGELFVDDVGQGPPVVLWHSFLHHGGMWRGVVDALRTRHRLINVDAPGHGRSAKVDRPLTMDDCASALAAVYEACGIERAHFAGLSWGGMVGMTLALRASRLLGSMVLLDTSCRREPLKNRLEYTLLGAIFRKVGPLPPLIRRVAPLFFAPATLRNDPALVEEWQQYVVRLDGESVWHTLQCIVDRPDVQQPLTHVRVPTLVVVGAEDRAQPPSESRTIAAAIPGARLVTIDGAGHLSALERPLQVAAHLASFFGEHPLPIARATT